MIRLWRWLLNLLFFRRPNPTLPLPPQPVEYATPVGRADLVVLLSLRPSISPLTLVALTGFAPPPSEPSTGADTEAGPGRIARLLGYLIENSRLKWFPQDLSAAVDVAVNGLSAKGWPEQRAPTVFWRVEKEETVEDALPAPARGEGLRPSDQPAADASLLRGLPPKPPITPWSALEPRLRAALNAGRPDGELDLPQLCDQVAARVTLDPLPRTPRHGWPTTLGLWFDRADRLMLLAEDTQLLQRHLQAAMGSRAIAIRQVDDAIQALSIRDQGHFLPDGLLPDTLLVVGDLGLYGDPSLQEAWRQTGLHLRRRGIHAVALLPFAPASLPSELRAAWTTLPWEPKGGVVPDDPAERQVACRPLLRIAAATGLLQPGLLRALRRLLPGAPLHQELDLLTCPELSQALAVGLTLDKEAAKALRVELFATTSAAELAAVRDTLSRWRAAGPAELRHAETLWWINTPGSAAALPPGDAVEARAFLARVSSSLSSPSVRRTWGDFARCLLERLPKGAYTEGADRASFKALFPLAFADQEVDWIPEGVSLEGLSSRPREPRWMDLRQVGARFVLESDAGDPGDPATPRRPGSPIARIWVGDAVAVGPERARHEVEVGWEITPDPTQPFVIEAGGRRLTIAPWVVERDWAIAAGRDRFGLWADVDLGGLPYRMRWIPPGRFWMGSPESEEGRRDNEGPRHEVVLTQGYWLGQTPVTQAHWLAVKKVNPAEFKGTPGSPEMLRPVNNVSWYNCRDFASPFGLRLPTEAEWERACRAGTDGPNYAPDVPLTEIGWYAENSGSQTQPVGRLRPNRWGLYDTLGNVWEWCHGSWRTRYKAGTQYDPQEDNRGGPWMYRGGGWAEAAPWLRAAVRDDACPETFPQDPDDDWRYPSPWLRAAHRFYVHPGHLWRYLGVRLARGPALQPSAEPTTSE